MELTPNTITLTTIDGGISVILNFMGAFKGDDGADGEDGEDGEDGADAVIDITSFRLPIIEWDTEERYAVPSDEYALILGNYPTAQLFKVAQIPEEEVPKFGQGTQMSLRQKGAGVIHVEGDEGVTIVTPDGYLPQTRAQGAIITLTCEFPDTNEWVLSSDLALEVEEEE